MTPFDDDDFDDETIVELGPDHAITPTVHVDACPQCGGPCGIAGPMDLVSGFPAYCLRSAKRKWFWCAGKRLLGCYVPA